MRKLCFHKPFLFVLITAFLFFEWSLMHVHLGGEHSHYDEQHQHAVTAHQYHFDGHYLGHGHIDNHHADAIDVAIDIAVAGDHHSHADSHQVVEVDQACTQFHGKLGQLFAFVPASVSHGLADRTVYKQVVLTLQHETFQSYLQYSSIRLRAPPLTA